MKLANIVISELNISGHDRDGYPNYGLRIVFSEDKSLFVVQRDQGGRVNAEAQNGSEAD